MYDAIQYALIVMAMISGLIMLGVGLMSALDNLLDFCGGDDEED